MTPTTDQLKDLMSKVTPGPWVSSTHGTQVLTGDSWNTICELRARKDFTRARWEDGRAASDDTANATLIALAPTLAAEVVRLRGDLDRIANLHCGWGDSAIDTMHDMIRIARQALDGTSAG